MNFSLGLSYTKVSRNKLIGDCVKTLADIAGDKDAQGILKSLVFPGLWLDQAALLAGDMAQVLAVLQTGMATAEYPVFL